MAPELTRTNLLEAITAAWDSLWVDVVAHPEILLWRETHTHVVFGHYLLCQLTGGSPVRLWDDVLVTFDEHSEYSVSGTLTWEMVCSTRRPDILIRPRPGRFTGDDVRGFIVELKVIRSILKWDVDHGKQLPRSLKSDETALNDAKEKLLHYSQFGSGRKYQGVLCLLHVHDNKYGPINGIFPNVPWADLQASTDTTIRRCLTFVDAPQNSSLDFLNFV